MSSQDKPGTSKHRVKVVMRHPVNLLFIRWLTEMRDEAIEKKYQSAQSYNKAIKSLEKYPLALTSGKETKMLQNVGDKTAKMLDERLAEYKREWGEPTLDDVAPDMRLAVRRKKFKKKPVQKDDVIETPKKATPTRPYVPVYRSGPYALMLALYNNHVDPLGTPYLSKVDLQTKAQPFCEKSFLVPEKGSFYTAWSSMATLIEKNLALKQKSPAQYTLTPSGLDLAATLDTVRDTKQLTVGVNDLPAPKRSPGKKRKPEVKPVQVEGSSKRKKVAEKFTAIVPLEDSDGDEMPTSTWTRLPIVSDASTSSFIHSVATAHRVFKFSYLTTENEETFNIDSAEVRIDEETCDVTYKIRTTRKDLELCGRVYKVEVEEPNGLVTAFLQDDSVPLAPGYDRPSAQPEKIVRAEPLKPTSTSRHFNGVQPEKVVNPQPPKPTLKSFSSGLAASKTTENTSAAVDNYPQYSLLPGQYDIVLCVDNGEVSCLGNGGNSGLIKSLLGNGVSFDQRKLSVGDFLWIVRERVQHRPEQLQMPQSKELVLDFIIERKRLDDLSASIMDSRFHEQKHRLGRCGLRNVTYLFENCGNAKNQSIPYTTLQQAIINTQVHDGFAVKYTRDSKDTVGYLTLMTRYLQSAFGGKTFHSCSRAAAISAKTVKGGLLIDSPEISLMTFDEFNRSSVKTRPMSAREIFARQLMQFHSVTVEKAVAITQVYQTLPQLMSAYDSCATEVERENLLAKFKGQGPLSSSRTVGPLLSKTIKQFFTQSQRFSS